MPKLSKDIPDAAEALVALQELTTEKDVRDFIKGDALRSHVTCEDVIKKMRAEGKRI